MAEFGQQKGDGPLLVALAQGRSTREAARRAKVSERTATRRMADPEFRIAVAEARAAMVERALGKLADGSTEAVDTLRRLLKAKAEGVRLSAARAFLEVGNKLRENVELEQRIRALEEKGARRRNYEQTRSSRPPGA
jgi:HEAT repeat protein